ncbi:MAG TPA: hypothetical protein VKE40_12195, partial [Gemmataceae bacterium]|nr:hypothetical protein [Gemmataceae bacterium]
ARRLARTVAEALPDRKAAAHRAIALLAKCVSATEQQKSADAPAEVERYVELAIKLVAAARPADWSALRADPDCASLQTRPKFAQAVGQ